MANAKCCDRCGNFMKLNYTDGSPYVTIGEKILGSNTLKAVETMDLCPACMTELKSWLHIYDDEKEVIDEHEE